MMAKEELWADINNPAGCYLISNYGRVLSLPRTAIRCGSPYPVRGRNFETDASERVSTRCFV
jgi:NUMOD4 motif